MALVSYVRRDRRQLLGAMKTVQYYKPWEYKNARKPHMCNNTTW